MDNIAKTLPDHDGFEKPNDVSFDYPTLSRQKIITKYKLSVVHSIDLTCSENIRLGARLPARLPKQPSSPFRDPQPALPVVGLPRRLAPR